MVPFPSRFINLMFCVVLFCFFLSVTLNVAIVSANQPIEVGVSLNVHQITEINQKSENFSVVATLIMRFVEPTLADESGEKKLARPYLAPNFVKLMEERGLIWPVHSFYNLQGRVDYQTRIVTLDTQGNITYVARFTATFQAPDFDFRHFPLDHQNFYIKLDSLPNVDRIKFIAIPDSSGIGDNLGEEEWKLKHTKTEVTTHNEFGENAYRFVLGFTGSRHLDYYILRILIPVIIIILVSWFTFFLKDYSKRIDLTSGNLLLFIAFNFTISNDLPRLGYITLMDTFLLVTFATTGFVVLANVWLRRLQNVGREMVATNLDRFFTWGYPVFYFGGGFLMLLLFHY